ncbi:hypothetical protein K3495_g3815 [Podosphaera aphanis]|nr:hypothetical protein K3495_g3815 [Podosphaera aphanis]
MGGQPFVVKVFINDIIFANTLIDTGYLSCGLCDSRFAQRNNFARLKIKPREVIRFDGEIASSVGEVAVVGIDLDGHRKSRVFLYISPIGHYDVILRMPWITSQDVRINGPRSEMVISSTGTKVLIQVFAASMADINKALAGKQRSEPIAKLPVQYHEYLDVFNHRRADLLPPLRGQGIDHGIKIENFHGKEAKVPWGPLYGMSREELLVLRKTLTELLDKGFIRVRNSPAAALVLFVKKPGGGLGFCVDYRGLNRITRKYRYPLPLIYETLSNISKAKWFTKLDVIAAFHKIRIAEGDEWKTAFRTRYGLYEWMVTPFGLANAPSTFQKVEHQEHVRKVLQRLPESRLQIDIDKCEFETTTTKYLRFIIEAGHELRMDPEKIKAIKNWEAPTSIKGVRGFLGFANFYRKFIHNLVDLARPLTDLTRKDCKFQWSSEADRAFHKLKDIFISAPALSQFDYDKATRIKTDSSGWCTRGTLQQLNDKGLWVPCAFFSKKNNSAEYNYEIYDKEMLAIICCLGEWDAELRRVKQFDICTDHKNLEYFMTVRRLTEW